MTIFRRRRIAPAIERRDHFGLEWPRRVEGREARKTSIDRQPCRSRCARNPPRQRLDHDQGLDFGRAVARHLRQRVRSDRASTADVDGSGGDFVDQRAADDRQHMHVLVAVDMIRREAERRLEQIELAADLAAHFDRIEIGAGRRA